MAALQVETARFTGAVGGTGAASAKRLAAKGAAVALLGLPITTGLDRVLALLPIGLAALFTPADAANKAQAAGVHIRAAPPAILAMNCDAAGCDLPSITKTKEH